MGTISVTLSRSTAADRLLRIFRSISELALSELASGSRRSQPTTLQPSFFNFLFVIIVITNSVGALRVFRVYSARTRTQIVIVYFGLSSLLFSLVTIYDDDRSHPPSILVSPLSHSELRTTDLNCSIPGLSCTLKSLAGDFLAQHQCRTHDTVCYCRKPDDFKLGFRQNKRCCLWPFEVCNWI